MSSLLDVKVIAEALGGDPCWFAGWCSRVGVYPDINGKIDGYSLRKILSGLIEAIVPHVPVKEIRKQRSRITGGGRYEYYARLRETLENYGLVLGVLRTKGRRTVCDAVAPDGHSVRFAIFSSLISKTNSCQAGFTVSFNNYDDCDWFIFLAGALDKIYAKSSLETKHLRNKNGLRRINFTFSSGVRDDLLENRIQEILSTPSGGV